MSEGGEAHETRLWALRCYMAIAVVGGFVAGFVIGRGWLA
jgi:hypothetical protein